MGFWSNLFGQNKKDSKPGITEVKHQPKLIAKNPAAEQELEKLVKELIKPATWIEVLPPSRMPDNAQVISHFGGLPYFEQGESWPQSKNGNNLSFIFQVFNADGLVLPPHIKLVQFYYDWDEFPWDTENDGWKVKIYDTLVTDKMIKIEHPAELDQPKYCAVNLKPAGSLPDWEGLNHFSAAANLAAILNDEDPWDYYDDVATKLLGEQDYRSQLGGYPRWVQGESTPVSSNGDEMKLLFQVDSEDNADLMWGDVGLIYVFYDETTRELGFTLQCH